ncbi:MAG: hypothetical protein Q7V31_12170 [Parvibaculum sp.]|uniref:hypothetical protein n=1 Tax=Parvibaculum sp. TaxID=2024848 RepID=UPI00271AE83B|nr:hypothetical protein [Parvibaculum sp.]MDO8839673.1 hypothetical protein [Parvibaculum sp.]
MYQHALPLLIVAGLLFLPAVFALFMGGYVLSLIVRDVALVVLQVGAFLALLVFAAVCGLSQAVFKALKGVLPSFRKAQRQ